MPHNRHVRMLNVKFLKRDLSSTEPGTELVWSKNRVKCLDKRNKNMEHALNFYCVRCNPQQTPMLWTSEKCKIHWIIADDEGEGRRDEGRKQLKKVSNRGEEKLKTEIIQPTVSNSSYFIWTVVFNEHIKHKSRRKFPNKSLCCLDRLWKHIFGFSSLDSFSFFFDKMENDSWNNDTFFTS